MRQASLLQMWLALIHALHMLVVPQAMRGKQLAERLTQDNSATNLCTPLTTCTQADNGKLACKMTVIEGLPLSFGPPFRPHYSAVCST